MTKREKIIVSAYTGVLMCDFDDMHKYIIEILGRPVYAYELAEDKIYEEIKEKCKKEFLAICANQED